MDVVLKDNDTKYQWISPLCVESLMHFINMLSSLIVYMNQKSLSRLINRFTSKEVWNMCSYFVHQGAAFVQKVSFLESCMILNDG